MKDEGEESTTPVEEPMKSFHYDVKCEELARHFLDGEFNSVDSRDIRFLAQQIQEAAEDAITDIHNRRKHSLARGGLA